ncbi:MAG: hypothetical protein ACXVQJ_06260, partial [Actinomycetota bacterium]
GFQRSAYDLALAYTRQREASLSSFSQGVSPQQTVLRSGLPAIQFGYTGVTFDREPVAGVVTVAVGPGGNGVVFDASWPEQDLAVPAGDIAAMIDGAAIA